MDFAALFAAWLLSQSMSPESLPPDAGPPGSPWSLLLLEASFVPPRLSVSHTIRGLLRYRAGGCAGIATRDNSLYFALCYRKNADPLLRTKPDPATEPADACFLRLPHFPRRIGSRIGNDFNASQSHPRILVTQFVALIHKKQIIFHLIAHTLYDLQASVQRGSRHFPAEEGAGSV